MTVYGKIKRRRRQKCKQRPFGALETLQMKFITAPGRLIKSVIACDDGQMLPVQVVRLRLTLVSGQLLELSTQAPLAPPIVLYPI